MKCKIVSGQTKLVVQDISPDLFYNNIHEKKIQVAYWLKTRQFIP